MKTPSVMVIKCKKCQRVIPIKAKERYRLRDIDCPHCGEENEDNFLIIWESNDIRIALDFDIEIKEQKG